MYRLLQLLIWLLCPALLIGQNDTPCNAIPISVSNGTCSFTPGTTVGATFQSDAANGGFPACGFAGSADVWYSFVVPASGAVAITLEPGSIVDAALGLYTGPCNAPVLIGCDDDSGLDMMPAIDQSNFTPGQTLFIRVWNNNNVGGTFGVCATESHSDCGTASLICSNATVTSNAYGGGTIEDGDWSGVNCIPDEYQSQWFVFQVLNNGTFSFTLTPDAIAPGMYPDYDWTLWRVNAMPFCEDFISSTPSIACNASSSMGPQGQTGIDVTGVNSSEPAGPGNAFSAPFPVQAGDIFYLWVNNFTNSSSGFQFQFDPSMDLNCDFDTDDPNITTTSTPSCPNDCNGSATTLVTNITTPLTYSWSANANGQNTAAIQNLCAGTYIVTVTAADGEIVRDTIDVLSSPAIVLQTSHEDNSSCLSPNGKAMVSATGGTGALSIEWSNAPSLNNDTLSGLVEGNYVVSVTDGNNCTYDTSVNVSTNIVYPEIIQLNTTDSIACGSLCTTFSPFVNGATQYEWDFGDGQQSSFFNPYHCYTEPGLYSVTLIARTNGGCTDTLRMANWIDVNALPQAWFTYVKDDSDLHAIFRDRTIGAVRWAWDLGDSLHTVSLDNNPEFTYPRYAEYCIQLTVWDTNNCSDQAQECIEFTPGLTVYVPNAFTPNDDGLNDVFRIQGYPIQVLNFRIFNRWGEQIFATQDPSAGWDGRCKEDGKVAPQDMYIYKTEVRGEKGQVRELTGHFLLVH
ncbi:MAG: hypothetical protein RLZZ543_330 [Bacteroidota bacterium]|jgi:gliding motility-associated-like protein